MLVSKSLDTNLHRSEKQTLFRFSALYILLSVVIVSVFSFIYYEFERNLMLQEKKDLLQRYAKEFLGELKELDEGTRELEGYPKSTSYNTAIYDSNAKLIYETTRIELNLREFLYLKNGLVHLVDIPESSYLGTQFAIITVDDNGVWLAQTLKSIALYGTSTFLFMMAVGYILLRLFLKPMRDALELLDRFIKDTTHELNTPVSTVVANIEMIDKKSLDAKLLKKINRIDIAAKTISNIYQDLTYLTLGNKIISNNENVAIEKLVSERVEYFTSLAGAKKVSLIYEIVNATQLYIDRAKLSKLLDNLLSNAIKYNKINGSILVKIDKNKIEVQDSGIGIKEEDIKKMQERYTRFNKSTGGFGIGMSIVSEIAKEYNLTIKVQSKIDEGTKVSVLW